MSGTIQIEVRPLGFVRVAVGQPRSLEAADRLWALYRAIRPEIEALERAARREGPRVGLAQAGGAGR